MKVAYSNIVNRLKSKPSIENISKKLLQLGHENTVSNNIIDIEFTPNRGDCLSINGLLRDLSVFYQTNNQPKIYEKDIDPLDIKFQNDDINACPNISFLKIDIEKRIIGYKSYLLDYFEEFQLKKNNLFADISNYISYETGQPTHCYDFKKLKKNIFFKNSHCEGEFETLLGKKVQLSGKNAVFTENDEIISLAGVMGGMATSCSNDTTSVLVECAYFNPEEIIGKSLQYDIQSDAAYKFERGADPTCHDYVLRRFIKIVEEHATIKSLEIYKSNCKEHETKKFEINFETLNNIIGCNLSNEDILIALNKLGFKIDSNIIEVPSYRSDIENHNDLAEEISRVIGYDSIKPVKIQLPKRNNKTHNYENIIRGFLISNGFYEVINNPFVSDGNDQSLTVDNPLDKNKKYIRNNLKDSLVKKLIFNERRQKDSIKLFEISNLYNFTDNQLIEKRNLGIIASGRQGKNYDEFSKQIDEQYFKKVLNKLHIKNLDITTIPRDNLKSKNKNEILFIEIDISEIKEDILNQIDATSPPNDFTKYKIVSEYPSSTRDLSFSVKQNDSLKILEKMVLNYKDPLIKDVFVFDYFSNNKTNELKIGFRFIFQSDETTILDIEVENIINDIINQAYLIKNVEIPGLIRWQRKKL